MFVIKLSMKKTNKNATVFKKNNFQNIKIKLNSREHKELELVGPQFSDTSILPQLGGGGAKVRAHLRKFCGYYIL